MVTEINLVGSSQREWLIDTSATRHICFNSELFTTFKTIDSEKVCMGNYVQSAIEVVGKVVQKMISEKDLTLNNMLYMLEVQELSFWFADEQTWILNGVKSNKVVFSRSGIYVGKDYILDGIFKLNVITFIKKNINNFVYLFVFFNIWHGRLDHVNCNSLRRLINMNLVPTFQTGV